MIASLVNEFYVEFVYIVIVGELGSVDWADHTSKAWLKAQAPLSVMSLGCHGRTVLGSLTLDPTITRALGVPLSPS